MTFLEQKQRLNGKSYQAFNGTVNLNFLQKITADLRRTLPPHTPPVSANGTLSLLLLFGFSILQNEGVPFFNSINRCYYC